MKWPFVLGLIVSLLTFALCIMGPKLSLISREYSSLRAREALIFGVINVEAYNAWIDLNGGMRLEQTSSAPNPDATMDDARALSDNFTAYYGLERYAFTPIAIIAAIHGCICIVALFKSRATTPTPTP